MKGKRCRLNKPKSSFGIYAILFPSNIDTGIDVQLQQYVCDFCKYSVNILHIFNAKKSFRFLIFYSKIGVRVLFYILISHYGQMNSKEHNMLKSKEFQEGKGV